MSVPSPDVFTILAATVRDVSFWTGLATVFAFSQGRFSEKQIDDENIDPPLPARCFTTRFRYYSSALVFAGVYVFLFVCLIIIGSFPAFQDILRPLFGSLSEVGASATDPSGAAAVGAKQTLEIGTPAWAAMVMMVIAPTVPWINRAERLFRLWLQEFSDTPFKARGLADEIVHNLLVSSGGSEDLDHASEERLTVVFHGLENLRHQLTSSGRWKRDQSYRDFYAENGELLARTVDQFRSLETEIASDRASRSNRQGSTTQRRVTAAHAYRTQMANLVRRLSRLLACALLYSEAEEYGVRERLRQTPQMCNLPPATFRFTAAQVILAVSLSALIAFFSGPITSLINNTADAVLNANQIIQQFQYWGPKSIMIGIAFTLPLLLVAAIRLYLIDLKSQRLDGLKWDEKTIVLLFAVVGCFGLAALPSVAYHAYIAGRDFDQTILARGILWALPPAIVNAAFVFISEIRWGQKNWHNALGDFLTFSILGTAVAVMAGALLALVDLVPFDAINLYGFMFRQELPFVITVAIISVFNGMVQCGSSRVAEEAVKTRVASGVPDYIRSAASRSASVPTPTAG